MLFFGYKKLQNPLRAVKHENSTGVYDIVAYDTYLQPLSEGVYTSPASSSLVISECLVQLNIHILAWMTCRNMDEINDIL